MSTMVVALLQTLEEQVVAVREDDMEQIMHLLSSGPTKVKQRVGGGSVCVGTRGLSPALR